MRLKSFWALATGTTIIAALASAFAGDGAVTDTDRIWQVRYHKDHKSKKTGDVALRLHIKPKSGGGADDIVGKLTRYDDVNTSTHKYKPRDPAKGGVITFDGAITQRGGGSGRKREEFELLNGTYIDPAGAAHVVTIRGFHHGGKDRNTRDDDYLCIRINDKLAAKVAAGVRVPYVDCDEQPPDEDNLSEEPAMPDPPDYP